MFTYNLKRAFFFFLILLSGAVSLKSQGFESIITSFKDGNASALASNFDVNVEITIKSSGNSYSKNQAEMVMRDFFNTNSPKSFALVHQGTSPEGAKYFIANMSTSTGIYRAYVYAKTMAGKLVIQEIRVEE